MKKFFLTSLMVAVFAMLAMAQDTEAKTTDNANGPKLSLETTTVDYGVMEKNAEPLRTVKLTNAGNEPLIIKSARGNCGCTVPKWPKEPILPGETKELEIRYATNRVGKFSKKVTLTTNEGETITHVITVKGEVLQPETEEGVPAGNKNMLNSK